MIISVLALVALVAFTEPVVWIAGGSLLIGLCLLVVYGIWRFWVFDKKWEALLDEDGLVCAARVVDASVEIPPALTWPWESDRRRLPWEEEVRCHYLDYRFVIERHGSAWELDGRVRLEPDDLVDAGRHPEPAMMVGEFIQIRYLPSYPSVQRLESLWPDPKLPGGPPDLSAVREDETSESSPNEPPGEEEGDVTPPPVARSRPPDRTRFSVTPSIPCLTTGPVGLAAAATLLADPLSLPRSHDEAGCAANPMDIFHVEGVAQDESDALPERQSVVGLEAASS